VSGVKDNAIDEDRIICGDAKRVLPSLPDGIADLIVTSPPYFLHRDYGADGQLGREATVGEYTDNIRGVLKELLRVTADTGACFFVIGDTYRQ
jgi:DNA modification methylase